jgi:molybdopterin-guanine dinucleotide biosynthesis protein A
LILPHSDAAGFVLAGGQSTRMGADKALMQFAGQPLVTHALRILRDAGVATSIAGARSDLSSYAPVIEDASMGLGPLSGVCAALSSTMAQWAVFVPVDLPLLPSSLVRYLLFHAQVTGSPVTIASVSGFPQTFPAVILRDAQPILERELQAGRLGCYAAYLASASTLGRAISVLPVEVVVQAGQVLDQEGLPPSRWFANLNSPRDLERAVALRPFSHRVI